MSAIKQFRISKASYPEAVEWLEAELEAKKVSQEEMMTAEFLLEENFLRLAAASGEPEGFSAEISLHKRLGDVNLLLIAKGEPHNPVVELDENSDDEEERYVLASLKAHRQKMSYVRRQGCNIVSIQVHESSNKQMYHMLLGMAGGILLGLVLKFFLGAEALGWIEHNIFSSVEILFMSVLQMMIAPHDFPFGGVRYCQHFQCGRCGPHGRQDDGHIGGQAGVCPGDSSAAWQLPGSHA